MNFLSEKVGVPDYKRVAALKIGRPGYQKAPGTTPGLQERYMKIKD